MFAKSPTNLLLAVLLAAVSLHAAPALKPREPEGKGPGYLGVTFQAVEEGLVVTEVKKDSPAAQADLRRGDVIIKIDTHSMVGAETGEMQKVVGDKKPGTVVSVRILRGDDDLTIKVKLGARPADFTPVLPVRDTDDPPPLRP
jgi:S1-C subfamily serine protease